MALRFQEKDDVDRAIKGESQTGCLIVILVLLAAITGAFAWFRGDGLASYEKELAFYIGCGFVIWLAAPFYYEFRIRTKEIDGKVSAIEKAVNASEEANAELLEKLTAIEHKLGELLEKVESMNPGEGVAYSTGGIREGLRTIEERIGRADAPR